MFNQITKKINSFLKEAIPNSNSIFIKKTFDVAKYFNYKDTREKINRCNVIYKINGNIGKS